MTDDELRAWFHDFHPRTRPDFTVEEPDGTLRTITNVEMMRYVSVAHILKHDLRKAAEISQFLMGGKKHG